MSEKEPKYTVGDTADECEPVLTPAPPVAAWPLTGDGHAIISGLLTDRAERDALLLDKADLQTALRHADAQREELLADLAACRAELATAQQALAGWAAQEAVRTGGNRRSPTDRFTATARAWRPYLPYAQQARIIAGLIAETEGETDGM